MSTYDLVKGLARARRQQQKTKPASSIKTGNDGTTYVSRGKHGTSEYSGARPVNTFLKKKIKSRLGTHKKPKLPSRKDEQMTLFKKLQEMKLTSTYQSNIPNNDTAAKGAKPLPTPEQTPATAGTGDFENQAGDTSVQDTLNRGKLPLRTLKSKFATTPGAPEGTKTTDPAPDTLKRGAKPLKGLTERFLNILETRSRGGHGPAKMKPARAGRVHQRTGSKKSLHNLMSGDVKNVRISGTRLKKKQTGRPVSQRPSSLEPHKKHKESGSGGNTYLTKA